MQKHHHSPAAARGAAALLRGLLDIVLPPVCPSCRGAIADDGAVCPACWSRIRFVAPPICPVQGTPFPHDLGPGALSGEALADPPPFRRARTAAIYDDVARLLVHRLKYQDRPELAGLLAGAMQRAGGELLGEGVLLVPVPLHPLRLWGRRFNQSALLAASLSRRTGLEWDPFALHRVRATARQVGLTARQRELNVRGAFAVPAAAREAIRGRDIVLVDDVYTSGATLKAAARALLRGGAGAVDVLTFARVIH